MFFYVCIMRILCFFVITAAVIDYNQLPEDNYILLDITFF